LLAAENTAGRFSRNEQIKNAQRLVRPGASQGARKTVMARRNIEDIATHDTENGATLGSASDSVKIDELTKIPLEDGDFSHSNDAANANAEDRVSSSGILDPRRYSEIGLKLSNFGRRFLRQVFGIQIGYCLLCANRWQDVAELHRPITDLCPKCRRYIRGAFSIVGWYIAALTF
jgi:hypothetical protein